MCICAVPINKDSVKLYYVPCEKKEDYLQPQICNFDNCDSDIFVGNNVQGLGAAQLGKFKLPSARQLLTVMEFLNNFWDIYNMISFNNKESAGKIDIAA